MSEYGIATIKITHVERNGTAYEVHTGIPTRCFWDAWRANKDAMRRAGYSVWRDEAGNWRVSQWKRAQDTSKPYDSSLPVPCPDGLTFRPYQIAGVYYMLAHPQCILADDPGLGKTIQIAGLINALEGQLQRVLIVCPAYLKHNWRDEMERWLITSLTVHVDGDGYATDADGIFITNYERVTKILDERELEIDVDLLVCDEAHYLKNPKALRTKVIFGQINAPRKVFVTGTPIVNRPAELWPILRAIDRHGLGASWINYHTRYCDAKKTQFGWDVSGASNVEELGKILRSRLMLRRAKAEVLTELPDKIRRRVTLSSNSIIAALKRESDVLEQLRRSGVNLSDLLEHGKPDDLAELTQARIDLALAKTPQVCEMVTDAVQSGPVVVFAWHRAVAEAAGECLTKAGIKTTIAHGGHSIAQRHLIVKQFQGGFVSALVATIGALGTGVTLTAASQVFFIELPWQPGVLVQAEDRLHRIGQRDTVVATYALADSFVDQFVWQKIVDKANVIKKALGS